MTTFALRSFAHEKKKRTFIGDGNSSEVNRLHSNLSLGSRNITTAKFIILGQTFFLESVLDVCDHFFIYKVYHYVGGLLSSSVSHVLPEDG